MGAVESQEGLQWIARTLVMAEVRKIETRKRVNMETIQLGPVGAAKDTMGLVTLRIKIRT